MTNEWIIPAYLLMFFPLLVFGIIETINSRGGEPKLTAIIGVIWFFPLLLSARIIRKTADKLFKLKLLERGYELSFRFFQWCLED